MRRLRRLLLLLLRLRLQRLQLLLIPGCLLIGWLRYRRRLLRLLQRRWLRCVLRCILLRCVLRCVLLLLRRVRDRHVEGEHRRVELDVRRLRRLRARLLPHRQRLERPTPLPRRCGQQLGLRRRRW